jgi:hypothetical protein
MKVMGPSDGTDGMSRLSEVLDSGAEAAQVRHGLWQATVWHDTQPGREGWWCWVAQPQEADEDLAPTARLRAPDLGQLAAQLARYPYFLTEDLPWKPGQIPSGDQA